jgi:hypothetical protein
MAIKLKNFWKNIKAVILGVFLGLVICEIILRIYNPFPFSLKKGKLILPANQTKVFSNHWINKLDRQIHYSRNSLGFRGPELPDSVSKLTRIITIGGSTTECKFLSDSCTWPFLLYKKLQIEKPAIWLNNAGVDGHSTFGHLLLMDEYILKLKPDYVLFLTGINDEEIDEPDEFDRMTENRLTTNSFKGFLKSLLNHTELGRTAFNFYHVQIAYKKGLIHREVNLNNLVSNPLPDSIMDSRINNQAKFLTAYRQRINGLITKCTRAGIKPILITQPSLFGNFIDSTTQVHVGNNWVTARSSDNCMLEEKVLELYNDVLRSFGDKVMVVDLSKEMPKNSVYYYDFIHFTNEGARKVAEILFNHLNPVVFNYSSP